MSRTGFCQFNSNYSSSRERSISLCLEFKENDDVEQGTIKSEEETKPSLWERILQESENNMAIYRQWWEEKLSQETKPFFQEGPGDYLNLKVFPLLLPALKDMLIQARQWNALKIQKCRFNGIDFLAEKLWNQNSRHPERLTNWLDVFNIPPFKICLKLHPRPIYPKSWIWTEDEAATIIQKYIRGWLVRKLDNQEMTHSLECGVKTPSEENFILTN